MHHLARALVLGLALLSGLAAQAPSFTSGNLDKLACKVVELKPGAKYHVILVVEVDNRGEVAAEPLTFQIELAGKKDGAAEVFERAQLPHANRIGRPAPAGGKQRYHVPTGLLAAKGQHRVRVTAASFLTAGTLAKPDVVGATTQVQRTSLSGTFNVPQVSLRNPFDAPLDVLLLMKLVQPIDSLELVGTRLPPKATVDLVIGSRPGIRTYIDPESAPGVNLKPATIELVDWCLVGAADQAAGATLLQSAYERWLRWPDGEVAFGAKFRYRSREMKPLPAAGHVDYALEGRFTVDADGKVAVSIERGSGTNPLLAILDAVTLLRRPDFATLRARNELVPLAADSVELRGPGWNQRRHAADNISTAGGAEVEQFGVAVQLRDGRIVGVGQPDQREVWETQTHGAGYLVTRRRGPLVEARFTYREQDGRIVPWTVTRTFTAGDKVVSNAELTLDELSFTGTAPITKTPPQGEGAAALRAAWDAAYRLPTGPVRWTADFEVKNPGTQPIWNGHKKLSGKVEMTGLGRHMQHAHFTFDGNLAPEVQTSMAAAIRDRLLMWYGVDPNDRPTFDDFFAGATVSAPAADGSFAVAGSSVVERVLVDRGTGNGLVRGWRSAGTDTTVQHRKFGERFAVTRVELKAGRSSETVTIALVPVGEHLLPTSIEFQRQSSVPWGPELLTFKNIAVK